MDYDHDTGGRQTGDQHGPSGPSARRTDTVPWHAQPQLSESSGLARGAVLPGLRAAPDRTHAAAAAERRACASPDPFDAALRIPPVSAGAEGSR